MHVFPAKMSSIDYVTVEIRLRPLSEITRHLICRILSPRSILVVNIPPQVKEEAVKELFKNISPILDAFFCDHLGNKLLPNTIYSAVTIQFNHAMVLFADDDGVKKLQKKEYDRPIVLTFPLTNTDILNPMEVWTTNYLLCNMSNPTTMAKANQTVAFYDQEQTMKRKLAKETPSNDADEEGWITVRRHRPDNAARDQAWLEEEKRKQAKKRRAESNISDLYQYKMRTKKLDNLRELRKKFEEDKFKIAQKKADRKFRPQ